MGRAGEGPPGMQRVIVALPYVGLSLYPMV
jgi:hypothetical protein